MTILINMARGALQRLSGQPIQEVPDSIAAPVPQTQQTGLLDRLRETTSKLVSMEQPVQTVGEPMTKPNVKLPEASIASAIDLAASKIGVDRGYMYAMAAQESSFRPGAKAKTSSALGLYQFLDGTWKDVVRKYGKEFPQLEKGRTDPEAAAIGAALYTRDNAKFLERAKIEVTPTAMYATHFLGPGGARTLFRADDSKMAADVLPAAARANPAVFKGKTVAQVKSFLASKVGQRADKYNAFFSASNGE